MKLKSLWFPVVEGDILFDVILKMKCKVYFSNSNYKLIYKKNNKIYHKLVGKNTLFSRYIPLEQLTGIRVSLDEFSKSWMKKYLNKNKGD